MLSTEWNLNDENQNNFNPINWFIILILFISLNYLFSIKI